MSHSIRLGVVAMAWAALAGGAALGAGAEVLVMRCPGGGVQPQAAVDSQGRIHLIELRGDERACDIFYARSDDAGRTWTPAVRVNSAPGAAIMVGTVRGAQIAIGRGDRPHVAWMGSQEAAPRGPKDSIPFLYARLSDDGKSFEAQRNLITTFPGLDGGGSVAADAGGNVYVAWHAPTPGVKGEIGRRIYLAKSQDDGKTFAGEAAVGPAIGGVCACCGIRVAAFPGGAAAPVVLVRGVDESGMNRDMVMMGLGGDGKAAALSPWRAKTCPMSTTTAAALADGSLAVAWEGPGQILAAVAAPGGGIGPVVQAPGKAGARKHPGIAASPDGKVLIAWADGTGWKKGGTLGWQLFEREGPALKAVEGSSGSARGLPVWSLPTAVCAKGKWVVVY